MATSTIPQPLGAIVRGNTNSSTVSVPNDTGKAIGTLTLTKGVWLIIICADWQGNATGYRQLAFADGVNPSRQDAITSDGYSSKETYQQLLKIVSTDGGSLDYYARQTSGGSLNVYPYAYAVLIGNR